MELIFEIIEETTEPSVKEPTEPAVKEPTEPAVEQLVEPSYSYTFNDSPEEFIQERRRRLAEETEH